VTKPKRLRIEPVKPSAVALVTAQAIDMLAGQAIDDDGQVYDEGSAAALVLLHRQRAGLPNPAPRELVEALAYVRHMRALESPAKETPDA